MPFAHLLRRNEARCAWRHGERPGGARQPCARVAVAKLRRDAAPFIHFWFSWEQKSRLGACLEHFFFLSKKNNHPTPPRAGSTQEPRRHFTTSRTPPLQSQPRATGQCRYPRGEAKTEQHRRRVPHGQQVKKFLLSAVCASKETFPNTAGALLPSL